MEKKIDKFLKFSKLFESKPSEHRALFFLFLNLVSSYGTGSKDDGAKKFSRDRDGLVYHSRTKAVLYRGACIEQPLYNGGRGEDIDGKARMRRELVTGIRADKHRSRRHVSDWNDNRVPRDTGVVTLHPPIVSDLQVQTALEEEKEEDTPLDRIVSGFFFFLVLEIIGSIGVEVL